LSIKEFAPRLSGLRVFLYTVACVALIALVSQASSAQAVTKEERERGQRILQTIKGDIKDKYYDPTFRGLDIEARFKAASAKIEEATTPGHINGIIAQVLLDLNDSHTFFIPPPWAFRVDYGWEMQTFGDKCYVVRVEPNSDARAKGLRVGDEVYSVDGIWLTPKNFWKFKYMYHTLRPRTRMQVVVQRPDGQQVQLDIEARVTPGKARLSIREFIIDELIEEIGDANSYPRYREVGDDLIIWKIPEFDLGEKAVDEMMKKVKGRKSLILDLRGNPGGYVIALQRMAGYFFDHDVKIADIKQRGSTKEMKAKTRGKERVFTGKLVVLVDSESGSAAEILARLIQIEKRGTVIGDHTPGKVMRSRVYQHELGPLTKLVFFALSVTNADLIMADGKSLEGSGVAPDELILPTPADLAARRDPVMSRAAAIVGVEIDPEQAGTFFPRLRRLTFEEVEAEADKDKKDKLEKRPAPKNPYVELPHLSP
jgi:C-terminal processing protease CtpA/Prc